MITKLGPYTLKDRFNVLIGNTPLGSLPLEMDTDTLIIKAPLKGDYQIHHDVQYNVSPRTLRQVWSENSGTLSIRLLDRLLRAFPIYIEEVNMILEGEVSPHKYPGIKRILSILYLVTTWRAEDKDTTLLIDGIEQELHPIWESLVVDIIYQICDEVIQEVNPNGVLQLVVSTMSSEVYESVTPSERDQVIYLPEGLESSQKAWYQSDMMKHPLM